MVGRSEYLLTDFLWNQSETLKRVTSHKWSRTARVTRSRSPNLVQHVMKRDGRKRRKKSLYAQKPYVYVRIKSLYAQIPYVYVHTSRTSYAQVVHRTHKSYIVRTSCFKRISRLRAKAVLYVRIKSLYAHRRTSYAQSCLECTSRIRTQ